MNKWRLVIDPERSGAANMEADLRLLTDLEAGNTQPVLRIYSWRPKAITLGYSQKVDCEIDLEKAKLLGWDVMVRPTGGGIVFHNEAEVTYSLVIAKDDPSLPAGLIPAYKKISEAVVAGLSGLGLKARISQERQVYPPGGLCFNYPAEYEVVVNGKKIVGSAQKRGKKALLQQGSIFIRSTPVKDLACLRKVGNGLNAVSVEEIIGRKVSFNEVAEALANGFLKVFNPLF
ncbi:MAG: lipoate--protein ligase family protein [Candidatus Margulisiibacteriota bacterium]